MFKRLIWIVVAAVIGVAVRWAFWGPPRAFSDRSTEIHKLQRRER